MTAINMETWQPSSDDISLGTDEIHVWRASVDAVGEAQFLALKEHLTSDEIERARRYRFDRDRRRFVVRRGLLRNLLADYVETVPRSIRFDHNPFGKPYVVEGPNRQPPRFNVSHSVGLALFAFSPNHELGVDIERAKPLADQESVSQRFFAPSEIETMRVLPEHMQLGAFYRCWTRKEAFIKGVGKGLSIPLDSFEVSLDEASAELVRMDSSLEGSRIWSLYPLIPGSGFTGALAVKGEVSKIKLFDVDPTPILGIES